MNSVKDNYESTGNIITNVAVNKACVFHDIDQNGSCAVALLM